MAETAAGAGPLVALVALLAAVAPSSGLAAEKTLLPGIGSEDHRLPVETTDWPWAAIGRLNRGTGGHCTATLIAADRVLTAAHCVFNPRTGRMLPSSALHFLAGFKRGDFAAHATGRAIVTEAAAPAPGPAVLAAIARDWAVVSITPPLPIRPIPVRTLALSGPAAGAALLRAGYSQDRAQMLSVHDGCRIRGRLAEGRVLLTDCDATRGDSGSPLLLRGDGGEISLIGVTSAVADDDALHGTFVVAADAFQAALAARAPASGP